MNFKGFIYIIFFYTHTIRQIHVVVTIITVKAWQRIQHCVPQIIKSLRLVFKSSCRVELVPLRILFIEFYLDVMKLKYINVNYSTYYYVRAKFLSANLNQFSTTFKKERDPKLLRILLEDEFDVANSSNKTVRI